LQLHTARILITPIFYILNQTNYPKFKCFATLITAIVVSIIPWSIQAQDQAQLDEVTAHISENLQDWSLKAKDLESVLVTDAHTSKKSQVTHIYYRQSINEIEIFDANANANLKGTDLISFHQNFKSNINSRINTANPSLTSEQAISYCGAHLGNEGEYTLTIKEDFEQTNQKKKYYGGSLAYDDISAKLSYIEIEKALKLSWEIAINDVATNKWWQVFVDAQSGVILHKVCWTNECSFGHLDNEPTSQEHHHSDHCNHEIHSSEKTADVAPNSYNVFPKEYLSPLDGFRSIESTPWNTTASPYGWHDTNGVSGAEFTYTRGNNVLAQEDRNGNNGTGARPDGGSTLDFDFPYDPDDQPSVYEEAAVTNLFYWNNIMHDLWYQYGFDEASGNFQQNNYGNGGTGGDYVLADAQDGSGSNNANFSTPTEGNRPRMQMFEWNARTYNYLTVDAPSSIARNYGVAGASFGPQDTNIDGEVVEAVPFDACSALSNAGAMNGKIALIERGSCAYTAKVIEAQNAGAIAVIICNDIEDHPVSMSGTNSSITIPSVMIGQIDCQTIQANLSSTVEVTIERNSPVTKDSDLDNGVIAHEYGHGVSIRLTGGANTSSCLNNDEQMGEGWSDWFGLVTTIQPGDTGPKMRGVGAYLTGEPLNSEGIRTYPYTTNINVNTHTYDDIANLSIPHGVGSVWCEMLWEMTWGLIDEHGFDTDIYDGTGGNNLAMGLVIEALKLQPCSPGFIDGRDAILQADQVLNNGDNECIIWEAFAKRGLGFSATQGSTDDADDGTEAFDLPTSCQDVLLITKNATTQIEAGDPINYTIHVTNNRDIDLTNVIIKDTLPPGTNLVTGTLDCGSVSSSIAGDIITITESSLTIGSSIFCEFEVSTNGLSNSTVLLANGAETGQNSLTASAGTGSSGFTTSSSNPFEGANSWFVPNVGANNSQFLTSTSISLGADPYMIFVHDYDTETGWDGGMVEISTDNGSTWIDLGPEMIINPYDGTLGNGSNNDIDNRSAFTGNSNGYIETHIDLRKYANQSALIRFFFGSDNNTFEHGWDIDNVEVLDAMKVINEAIVTSAEGDTERSTVSTLLKNACFAGTAYFIDNDGDGYGDPTISVNDCTQPAGYVLDDTDCDDADPEINPAATEICDGIDNNCNGQTDEGLTFIDYFLDNDNDGFGDPNNIINDCLQPSGYVTDNTDCDDNDANINPAATEVCDGIDNNCDGQTDEGLTFVDYFLDNDNDGFGDVNNLINDCQQPSGYVTDNTDCDDNDANINPAATEICDGIDNNCDGQTDEGLTFVDYFLDNDNDGYGDVNNLINDCQQPSGYVTDSTDCNDNDASINPAATETCDGVDNDCDGQTDEGCSLSSCDGQYLVINTVTMNTYRAEINIVSDTIINNNGQSYLFTAGTDIDLDPGFEVVLGTEFEARIEACTPFTSDPSTSKILLGDLEDRIYNLFDRFDQVQIEIQDIHGNILKQKRLNVFEFNTVLTLVAKELKKGEYKLILKEGQKRVEQDLLILDR